MKKYILAGLILIFCIFTYGCSINTVSKVKSPAETGMQDSIKPGLLEPNTGNTSTGQAAPAGIDTINVSGNGGRLSLHSLDFINENSGWVIADTFNSISTGSRILNTQDAGNHWEETVLDNMKADKILFIDETTGWIIAHTIDGKTTDGAEISTMRILYTPDCGKTFTVQWKQNLGPLSTCELWFQDKLNGYALINGLMLSTRDGGKQWTKVSISVEGFTPQHMDFSNYNTGWIIGIIEPVAIRIQVIQALKPGYWCCKPKIAAGPGSSNLKKNIPTAP